MNWEFSVLVCVCALCRALVTLYASLKPKSYVRYILILNLSTKLSPTLESIDIYCLRNGELSTHWTRFSFSLILIRSDLAVGTCTESSESHKNVPSSKSMRSKWLRTLRNDLPQQQQQKKSGRKQRKQIWPTVHRLNKAFTMYRNDVCWNIGRLLVSRTFLIIYTDSVYLFVFISTNSSCNCVWFLSFLHSSTYDDDSESIGWCGHRTERHTWVHVRGIPKVN